MTDSSDFNQCAFSGPCVEFGCTSNVLISACKKHVRKKVINYIDHDCYEREIHILKILNSHGYIWCPKLEWHDDVNKVLIMSYCGEMVTQQNLPPDYKSQIAIILTDMEKCNIRHNDIKYEEVLILDGKIHLCDFGWASICNDLGCGIGLWEGEKPCGVIKDINIIDYLGKLCIVAQ